MAYCVNTDVTAIVDTDMTPAEVTALIADVQSLQVLTLRGGGPNAAVRKAVCTLWTAIRVMLKDPNAQALGEYSEDRADALLKLNKHLRNAIRIASGGIAFKTRIDPI